MAVPVLTLNAMGFGIGSCFLKEAAILYQIYHMVVLKSVYFYLD